MDLGTPGSTELCELIRDFHPVLFPSCVDEDSGSTEGLQVCLERGFPRLDLASSSSALRVRRCKQNKVTIGTSCSVIKPEEPSLDELFQYNSESEAVPQFNR